ncbi:glycosyltransferase family 2 protein [Pseudokineococcus marinus]|uniref:NTP transferase domain-containing protein n=1 Tax=Pseudokineococcus marinus TaxID=351215 RepID=A0A849BN78_9ACTN|nr:glycosyltransferase family 2 protein [Pseudokineococcus marinus]NNH22803.1 NTP transferase domain-containing protein [Pseudokineococcus marinus]
MSAPSAAPVQVLMPMGGLGSRFRAVGVDTPKPLIDVAGTPMFRRALASFDGLGRGRRLVVVVREDAEREHGLAGLVREAEPGAEVVLLDHDTRGAVETCLTARHLLDPDAPLVVMDCDIAFDSPAYLQALAALPGEERGSGDVDGLLLSFRSRDPRYSFAELDEHGLVVRTAEKRAVSEHALMGAYTFARAGVFLEAADALMQRQVGEAMPEYYVSLVFNEMLAAGRRVGLVEGDFYCFGTPEELEQFLATGAPVR